MQGGPLLVELVDDEFAIDVVEIDQEFVWMHRFDAKWLVRLFREVLQVVSHDDFTWRFDGRRQNGRSFSWLVITRFNSR